MCGWGCSRTTPTGGCLGIRCGFLREYLSLPSTPYSAWPLHQVVILGSNEVQSKTGD